MKKSEVTQEQITDWVKTYAPTARGVTVFFADKTERVEAIQLVNLPNDSTTVLVTFLTDHVSHTYIQASGADRAEGYHIIWGHGGRDFRVWSLSPVKGWYDSHGARLRDPNKEKI